MRSTKWLLLIVSLTGCDILGAGTLGSFKQWTFPASEKRLDHEMAVFYKANPSYVIPEKWREFDNWNEGGYGFLKGKIIYFKENPEEMYYISYFETDANSPGNDNDFIITTIAVRAVNNGDSRWNTKEDFKKDKTEIDRIDKRFHDKIIIKLESQMKSKAENTTPWYENY